jgi:hypothetical protein
MKKELWLRLRGYHFTNLVPPNLWDQVAGAFGGVDASTRAFASKIARKHGWSAGFARRAIEEYRKFIFLGVTGERAVTPSKVIDTVWHEHVLFTRAYREFCRDVIGREFDHHPELLPNEEQTSLYAQQFDETLARYAVEFHHTPPVDIWGTPKFARDDVAKQTPAADSAGAGGADTPLYTHFDGRGDTPSHHDMPEFSGGGFSGGGGGSDWSDSGNGDADGGSADGGSGCSSGCGGD